MFGVEQWTEDAYQADYYSHSDSKDPYGPALGPISSRGSQKVVRGGWDGADGFRVSRRRAAKPTDSGFITFRCAVDALP